MSNKLRNFRVNFMVLNGPRVRRPRINRALQMLDPGPRDSPVPPQKNACRAAIHNAVIHDGLNLVLIVTGNHTVIVTITLAAGTRGPHQWPAVEHAHAVAVKEAIPLRGNHRIVSGTQMWTLTLTLVGVLAIHVVQNVKLMKCLIKKKGSFLMMTHLALYAVR